MRKPSRPAVVGILLGALAAAGVLAWLPRLAGSPSGPMMDEGGSALSAVVIQYSTGADAAADVYRSFLPQLDARVKVYAACTTRTAFDELAGRVGAIKCQLIPVVVDHAITAWSRDRWVALLPEGDGPTTLLCPRGENGAGVWPARLGDEKIAFDLSQKIAHVAARRSILDFDAGDLLADGDTVFVTPAVLRRNVQQTVENPTAVADELARELHRKIVLLDTAPDHHAGMYMMPAGDHTMLVADPGMARALLDAAGDATRLPPLPGGADFTSATQATFDAVARQTAALGYKVVRIPAAPAVDGKTYLTYVNVIIETVAGQRIVYMPTYRGAEVLNDAATAVWRGLGYRVCTVDCTSCYTSYGSLHCLVNVLARE
jgi:hypothetical protein